MPHGMRCIRAIALAVSLLVFATSAPSHLAAGDAADTNGADESAPAGLAEQLEAVQRDIANAHGVELDEALSRLARLGDRYPLEAVRPLVEPWRLHGRQTVRRAGIDLLLALEAYELGRPHFDRWARAGVPAEVAGAEFVRLHTGVPDSAARHGVRDRDGVPEPSSRYGWLMDRRVDRDTGETVFVLLTPDWRHYIYRRPADAPPGAEPRVTMPTIERTMRRWVADAHSGRVPAFEPLYAAARLDARAHVGDAQAWRADQRRQFVALLTMLAATAHVRGQRVLAGELLEGAHLLWQRGMRDAARPGPEVAPDGNDADDAPTPGPTLTAIADAFVEAADEAVAVALYRHAVEAWAEGSSAERTSEALRRLNEALPTERLDWLAPDLQRQLAVAPEPAERHDEDAGEPDSRARAFIDALVEVRVPIRVGPLHDDLGLFNDGFGPVDALVAMNVFAIPALIDGLDDRRPTRTVLPAVDGVPVVLRVGDFCWHVLRRITGEPMAFGILADTPVPSLDRIGRMLRDQARGWWREAPYRGDELEYLRIRVNDPDNPDRLAHLDRLLQVAPLQGVERMQRVAEQDAQLESTITERLLAIAALGETADGEPLAEEARARLNEWLGRRVVETSDALTRLYLARYAFETSGDTAGAPRVLADLEAGALRPVSYEQWREWLDWLRTVDAAVLPARDVRLAGLALAEALPADVRLLTLRYLCEPPRGDEVTPAPFLAAAVALGHDRRIVGSARSANEVPDVANGLLAPRWRDHAAAWLARRLDDPRAFPWSSDLVARDVAAAGILERASTMASAEGDAPALGERPLTLVSPQPEETPEEAGGPGRAEAVPQHASVPGERAHRALEALIEAPSRRTEELAFERARALGLGLYPYAASMIPHLQGEARRRVEQLCRELANLCRRVRVHVYGRGVEPACAERIGRRALERLGAWRDRPLSAAGLRTALRLADELADMALAEGVQLVRVELLICRLPRGRGAVVEATVELAAIDEDRDDDAMPAPMRVRMAVAAEGRLLASTDVTAFAAPDVGPFAGETFDAFESAANERVAVEARITAAYPGP